MLLDRYENAVLAHDDFACKLSVRCVKDSSELAPNQETSGNTNSAKEESTASSFKKKPLPEVSFKDDGSNAAASFFAGQQVMEKVSRYNIKGKERDKEKQIKELSSLVQKGKSLYEKAASDNKWYFPAMLQSGRLYVVMADRIKKQERNGKKEEERWAEAIGINQKIPEYYEQTIKIFQKALDRAREKNMNNEYVEALEKFYPNMFYESCDVFSQVYEGFLKSPIPDSASIVKEYVEYNYMIKEDAIETTHEDLEAYREELSERANKAKEIAISKCSAGVKAANKYGIKNDQVEAINVLLKKLQK